LAVTPWNVTATLPAKRFPLAFFGTRHLQATRSSTNAPALGCTRVLSPDWKGRGSNLLTAETITPMRHAKGVIGDAAGSSLRAREAGGRRPRGMGVPVPDRRSGFGTVAAGRLATLDRLLERLAAGFRREQRFSTELSHELRTPLARVIAQAELALPQQRRPADYRNALADVLRNAQQLSRTVDALVAAARHDSALTRGTADAYAVCEQALEAVAGLAAERGLELVNAPPTRPLRLGLDADLAERILQPVVENACRYGRSRVRIRLERHSSRIVYLVEDDGPGVSPDERESIFEPGIRGMAGQASNGAGGAGLGLALARRLAHSASGEIAVEADHDGGRFLVSLPAA
jgi:signal transduction histidine kinase